MWKCKLSPADWLMSDKILDEADEEIFEHVKVSREFDIPYCGGYSKDGSQFYLDRCLPRGFEHDGRFFLIDTPIILHEVVEKSLMEELKGIPYLLAHQCALRTERACVEAAKVPWAIYNRWCLVQIKAIGSRASYPNTPKNLDLSPYVQERDSKTLAKMAHDGRPLSRGRSS